MKRRNKRRNERESRKKGDEDMVKEGRGRGEGEKDAGGKKMCSGRNGGFEKGEEIKGWKRGEKFSTGDRQSEGRGERP